MIDGLIIDVFNPDLMWRYSREEGRVTASKVSRIEESGDCYHAELSWSKIARDPHTGYQQNVRLPLNVTIQNNHGTTSQQLLISVLPYRPQPFLVKINYHIVICKKCIVTFQVFTILGCLLLIVILLLSALVIVLRNKRNMWGKITIDKKVRLIYCFVTLIKSLDGENEIKPSPHPIFIVCCMEHIRYFLRYWNLWFDAIDKRLPWLCTLYQTPLEWNEYLHLYLYSVAFILVVGQSQCRARYPGLFIQNLVVIQETKVHHGADISSVDFIHIPP